MARCHLADNNPTEALAYLAKWLVHDGESAQLWEMTGDAFLAFGDEASAEAAWLRGTKIRASKSVEANAEICRKLALLYDKQGNQQQARIYRGWHQYEAGRLQWRDNNVRQGIVLLRQASEILPEQQQVWFYLAESYRALSDRTSARAAYQKCLAINKNHGRALTGLALSQ